MSVETVTEIGYGELEAIEGDFAYGDEEYENDFALTEQLEQVERGRLVSYAGKLAGRAALISAVAAGLLVGHGEAAEAAPAPTAPVACTKNGVQGIKLGQLCVTKEELRRPGACTKTDRFIGHTVVTTITLFLPVSRVANVIIAFGSNGVTDYLGDFCD